MCHFTLHTIYCDVGMKVYAATCLACSLWFLSILTQPSPYLCENIDIVVTVCVFSNTIQYFLLQTVLDFDAGELPHELIYVDEAGFNLAKTRHRGRNVIGQRAVVNVPGQRGGNITLCAAISVQGVLHNHATLGPYNTGQIIAFLDALHAVVQDRPQQPRFVVIWDNVSFHQACQRLHLLCAACFTGPTTICIPQ